MNVISLVLSAIAAVAALAALAVAASAHRVARTALQATPAGEPSRAPERPRPSAPVAERWDVRWEPVWDDVDGRVVLRNVGADPAARVSGLAIWREEHVMLPETFVDAGSVAIVQLPPEARTSTTEDDVVHLALKWQSGNGNEQTIKLDVLTR